jgi:hypothetical protein
MAQKKVGPKAQSRASIGKIIISAEILSCELWGILVENLCWESETKWGNPSESEAALNILK